jgi:hypothetical protein
MLSESAIPYISNDVINQMVRVFIGLHAYILIIAIGKLSESKSILDIRDNPENEILDAELRNFIKHQSKSLTLEARHQKISGILALVVSFLGMAGVLYIFGKENSTFIGYAFAAYSVTALTIRAILLSLGWLAEMKQHKEISGDSNEYNKVIRAFALKNLSVTLPLAIAGALVSAFLLHHVIAI